MAVLRWTFQAADDLEAVTDYIAHDSPHYAKLFAIEVMTAIERLKDFPNSGRVVPERGEQEFREVLCGRYRIIYRIGSDLVEILMIYRLNPDFSIRRT